jgi:hypothetical protein
VVAASEGAAAWFRFAGGDGQPRGRHHHVHDDLLFPLATFGAETQTDIVAQPVDLFARHAGFHRFDDNFAEPIAAGLGRKDGLNVALLLSARRPHALTPHPGRTQGLRRGRQTRSTTAASDKPRRRPRRINNRGHLVGWRRVDAFSVYERCEQPVERHAEHLVIVGFPDAHLGAVPLAAILFCATAEPLGVGESLRELVGPAAARLVFRCRRRG